MGTEYAHDEDGHCKNGIGNDVRYRFGESSAHHNVELYLFDDHLNGGKKPSRGFTMSRPCVYSPIAQSGTAEVLAH